jgi:hypothetical protein
MIGLTEELTKLQYWSCPELDSALSLSRNTDAEKMVFARIPPIS